MRQLIGFLVAGGVLFLAYALAAEGESGAAAALGPGGCTVLLFASNFLGSAAVVGSSGLAYELGVEAAYPAGEVTSAALLSTLFSVVSTAFDFAAWSASAAAVNAMLPLSCVLSCLFLVCFTDHGRRRRVDEGDGSSFPNSPESAAGDLAAQAIGA